MRSKLFSTSVLIAPLLVACGSDVPIGSGQQNATGTGASSGASGASGAAGSAGSGARPGVGGAAGAAGSVGTGGMAGAGTGGASGGTGGTGATGGGGATGKCVSNTTAVQRAIPAKNPRDTMFVGSALYFSESDLTDSKISRVQLPSGTPQVIGSKALYPAQADAFESADALVSDGTSVFWRTEEGAHVWKMPLAGGTPSKVASVPGLNPAFTNGGSPGALALNATHLYWVQGPNGVGSIEVEYVLYEAPLAGGTPKKLAAFQSDTNDITKTFQPISLRADATNLYFSRVSGGATGVHSLPLAGGPVVEFFGAGNWIDHNASDVFMVGGAFVWRQAKAGGGPSVVSMGLNPNEYSLTAQSVVVSSSSVYSGYMATLIQGPKAVFGCGVVLKTPIAAQGATPTILWEGQGRPFALSQSAGALAMVDLDNEEVVVLSP